MKETVNVNIGKQAFVLDKDAFEALKSYFEEIRGRLPEEDTESMDDIEAGMAGIFRELVPTPMRVVTLTSVREAMERMGAPDDFGLPRPKTREEAPAAALPQRRKLYRSRRERSIAGVCGGLAEYFDTDATPLRLVTLLLNLFGGLSVWIYAILWIVIPEAPAPRFDLKHKKR